MATLQEYGLSLSCQIAAAMMTVAVMTVVMILTVRMSIAQKSLMACHSKK